MSQNQGSSLEGLVSQKNYGGFKLREDMMPI